MPFVSFACTRSVRSSLSLQASLRLRVTQPNKSPRLKTVRRQQSNTGKDGAKDTAKRSQEPDKESIDVPSPLWYHRLGPVTDFMTWFSRQQAKQPLHVQFGTAVTTYLCGDMLAQYVGGEEFSPSRTLRMVIIGGVSAVPGYKW